MIRTKACKKCGEVIFDINSTCEEVEFVCKSCMDIHTINWGPYYTIHNKCDSCYNDVFKIKINDNEDVEQIIVECSECKSSPKQYYTDKEGNEIDCATRDMLIIQDSIKQFNDSINNLESRMIKLEDNIASIKCDTVENLSRKINDNKIDINMINYEVSGFSNELNGLKDMIKNIEKNIVSSLYLFK